MLKKLYIYFFVDDLLESSTGVVTGNGQPLRKLLMKDLSVLLLFSYMSFIFNPVMPLIADKMAHSFWEEYHLVTVHHIYGSAHTHVEMAEMAKHPDKDKSASLNSKSAADDYLHHIFMVSFSLSPHHFANRSYPAYKFYTPVTYPDIDYQPPQF